jgi:hypothetical protein
VAEELDSRKICTEQQRRLLFDCVWHCEGL